MMLRYKTSTDQGWGEYYSGTRLAQNGKHEYTKNTVLEYYSSTDFPVLVLVCSVLAPALVQIEKKGKKSREEIFYQMKVFFVRISCRKCFL